MTLSEFINAWNGFVRHQNMLDRKAEARAYYIVSAWVKNPPKPWESAGEGAQKPYTQEEKEEILQFHESVKQRAKRVELLTQNGVVDITNGE